MQPKIMSRFERLTDRRQVFLERIARLSAAQQRFKPAAEVWCALEVAEHLLIVELGLSERWLAAAPLEVAMLKPVTVRSQVLGWALVVGLRTPVRIKTPTQAADPTQIPTLEVVRARWQAHHERVRAQLEPLPVSALSQPASHHPMVKPLTLAQTLAFFEAHIQHHFHQLERLRRDPAFPEASQVI